MYTLTPIPLNELKNFFDDNSMSILKYFIKKSVFAQPEKKKLQKDLPVQIPKEHIEQWLVQAL